MNTQDITCLHTLQSMYDNNSIVACIDGKQYRIKMSDLIPMLDNRITLKTQKARKHTYLSIEDIDLNHYEGDQKS